jgi:hypothetical protein
MLKNCFATAGRRKGCFPQLDSCSDLKASVNWPEHQLLNRFHWSKKLGTIYTRLDRSHTESRKTTDMVGHLQSLRPKEIYYVDNHSWEARKACVRIDFVKWFKSPTRMRNAPDENLCTKGFLSTYSRSSPTIWTTSYSYFPSNLERSHDCKMVHVIKHYLLASERRLLLSLLCQMYYG